MSASSITHALALVAALTAAGVTHQASAQSPVKFSLDWKFEGQVTPFLVPLDKGYFKAEGLDVTIDTAGGSLEPLNRVASGVYNMASGDINSLIKFRDANPNAPIKAIFIVHDKPPFAIISLKSRGVSKPSDLAGKRLGAPAADAAYAQWNIFTQANKIDPKSVTVDNIGFPVREPMLAGGQVDAIAAFSFNAINLKERGVPSDDIVVMLMADHGVNLYGNAILVNTKFAEENPAVVRKFLAAFTKGLKETIRNPDDAIASIMKRNDLAKKEVELERLRMLLKDNIVTSRTRSEGLGRVDADRLDRSIDQIALTYTFKNAKPKAADIFDPSFLPPSSDLKLD
jgi:NitT/TauT family transport system substrate-binding protein